MTDSSDISAFDYDQLNQNNILFSFYSVCLASDGFEN